MPTNSPQTNLFKKVTLYISLYKKIIIFYFCFTAIVSFITISNIKYIYFINIFSATMLILIVFIASKIKYTHHKADTLRRLDFIDNSFDRKNIHNPSVNY